ncbi:MAG: beta-lactamase family protein [candidate division KSB1 bacterium]|nr:beta-lactamase family protein [candidate division KSB1 bacterium]
MWCVMTLLVLAIAGSATAGDPPPVVPPEAVGMSSERLRRLDALVEEAIANQDIPGAVLLVARKGKVVWRKAYGRSQLVPSVEPMRVDGIFDLASITKPVATASAVMLLVEEGRLRLQDPVRLHIPEFSPYVDPEGRTAEDARIFHLLTHTSGLPAYINADTAAAVLGRPCTREDLARYIARLPKIAAPGKVFRYSCLGFITLAAIVERVSGRPFDQFARERLFEPLGMRDTGFVPPPEKLHRVVPTEVVDGKPLRGVVHDPLARLQNGVSGNAGLFSTADDLLRFSLMLLNEGELDGVRLFSPLSVRAMTSVYPAVAFAGRGLGWDIASDYSSNGGDLFPPSGFGHTGYTGTSLWIDKQTQTVVILLANRVHPVDDGSVVRLRSLVANVVASAIVKP